MGMIIQNGKQYFPVYNDSEIKALPTTNTASGSVATFDTDMTENLVEVKCQIVAQQSGSGTPSPSNPRPIQTYTEMNVGIDKVVGFYNFNQFIKNGNFEVVTPWTSNNSTITVADNIARATCTTDGQIYIQPDNIPHIANHYYLISAWARVSDTSKQVMVSTALAGTEPKTNSETFTNLTIISKRTSDFTGRYPRLLMQNAVVGDYFEAKNFIMLDLTQMFGSELADEIYNMEQQTTGSGVAYVKNLLYKDYYEYNTGTIETLGTANNDGTGNTYNIPFGQTVANGVLDVTTGKLRVTHELGDLGSVIWAPDPNRTGRFYGGLSGRKPSSWLLLCDSLQVNNVGTNSLQDNQISGRSDYGSTAIFARIDSQDGKTGAEFKTYVTGMKVLFELATPIEIQLDSITLQALLNENNIWCDTNGDTEVKYLLSVGKKIA